MKTFLIPVVVLFIICNYSCQKNEVSQKTATAAELQYKWILDSIIVYQNADFTGGRFVGYIGNNTQYFNFTSTGKIYAYGGVPTPSYDTADYTLLPDNNILTYSYVRGVRLSKPDTFSIRTLTPTSLVLRFRNVVNEYGKYSFHR